MLCGAAGAHVVINGKPGGGKTVILLALAKWFKANGCSVRILTERCAMQEKLSSEFSNTFTIASFTCRQRIGTVDSRNRHKPDVYRDRHLREYAGTIWFVDEAWAASGDVLDFLLEMAAVVVKGSLRIICVGDHAQLPAIGIPAIRSKIFQSPKTVFLKMSAESVRFKGDTIMKIINDLRNSVYGAPAVADEAMSELSRRGRGGGAPGLVVVSTHNILDEKLSRHLKRCGDGGAATLTVLPTRERPVLYNRQRRGAKLVAHETAIFTQPFVDPETSRRVHNGTKATVLTWGDADELDEDTPPVSRVVTEDPTSICVLVRLHVGGVDDPDGVVMKVPRVISDGYGGIQGALAIPLQSAHCMTAHRVQGHTAPAGVRIGVDCAGFTHIGQLIVGISRGQYTADTPLHEQLQLINYYPGLALELAAKWESELATFLQTRNLL